MRSMQKYIHQNIYRIIYQNIYQNIYQIVEKGWEEYAERVFSSATPGACVQFKAKRSRIQEQMRNTGSMMGWNPLETVTLRGGAQPYPGCRPGFSRGQTPPRQVGRRGRARATGITPHNP